MKAVSPPHTKRRLDRQIHELVHDPYKTREKLPEPTVCPQCGAVYQDGRWTWGLRPAGAEEHLCQACHRLKDAFPAGFVTVAGAFLPPHRDEILHLIRHQEDLEKAEHPLHRIMGIDEIPDGLVVTTTDIHLPRRIGEALQHAFHGDLDFRYEDEEYRLRVHWRREDP